MIPMQQYSQAATDLGLSGGLKSQLETEEEQRKKKLLAQANKLSGPLGLATATLFPGLGG
jgi:hypothetical protein